MAKAKLTTAFLKSVSTDGPDLYFWDTVDRGFGIRVKAPDTRSFIVQYRNAAGKSRRETIGQFPRISLAQARAEARRRLAKATLGSDPKAERDAERKALTVAELCNRYLRDVEDGTYLTAKRRAPKSPSTIATDRGRIQRHILPLLGKMKVKDLRKQDVRAFYGAVKDGKTATDQRTGNLRGRAIVRGGEGTAKRTTRLLSAILSYAADQEIITHNPALGIALPKDGQRKVSNPDAIHQALGRAIRLAESSGETWQAAFILRLVALTGLRASEAVGLQWAEVDAAERVLRLRLTKTGQSVRPLSRRALELLEALRTHSKGSHVFPAARAGEGAFGGMPRAMKRITSDPRLDAADLAALEGFGLHRLRHAFATSADGLGLTLPTIAALLGHAAGGITAGYVGRVDAVLKAAADSVANHIAIQMGDEMKPAQVIAFKGVSGGTSSL